MKRSQSHSWSPRTSQSPSPLFILIVITVSCLLTFLFIANDFSIFQQGGQHGEFRILIGIMSPYWATARRQVVRNAYSRFPKNLPVDIIFVEGNITAPVNQGRARRAQHTVIEWENSTYGDIMHLDSEENLNKGKTYEFLKKVGREFGGKYSHVMKSDDDAFINLPALVEVIKHQKRQDHLYWGTTYRSPEEVTWGRKDKFGRTELWGSGYVLSMDLVEWIATSPIPAKNLRGLPEDWEVFEWLMEGKLDDNYVVNRTAFSEYPYPELADVEYDLWNAVRPYGKWIVVTHPLKYEWMFVEVAEYYLGLKW